MGYLLEVIFVDNNVESIDVMNLVGVKPIRTEGVVKWGNQMVEASFAATELECKLILALSAQLEKEAKGTDYTVISAKELGHLMQLNSRTAYTVLRQITSKLFERKITFKSEQKMANGKAKKEEWFHIFDRLSYDNERAAIGFKFSLAVEPLISQVKSAYVQVPLKTTMELKGPYSSRMLLFIIQWAKISPKIIALQELRERFQVGSKYKNNAEFIRTAISYSVKQINSFTKYNVIVTPIKTGRSITHIKFDITQKERENEPIDTTAVNVPDWNEEQKKINSELISYGISKESATALVNEHDAKYIRTNIEYALKKQKIKNIISFESYLYKCIIENYGGKEQEILAREARALQLKAEEKLAAMSQEERDEYFEYKDWLQGQSNVVEDAKNTSVDTNKSEKDKIKQEFFARTPVEQEHYVESIKDSLLKEPSQFLKMHFDRLINRTFADIVLDDDCLDLLAQYIMRIRRLDLDIEFKNE